VTTTHLGLLLAGSHHPWKLLELLLLSLQRLPSQKAEAAGQAAVAAAVLHLLLGPGSCQEGQDTAERTCKHDTKAAKAAQCTFAPLQ
jgi:hypothetical protein